MLSPRALIEVNGTPIRWVDMTDLKVSLTLYMAASTFTFTVRNDSYLSDWLRREQEVRVYIGYVQNPNNWSKSELMHIYTGKIDGVEPDFNDSMICQITGRDYAAPMLDSEFSMAYAERTASQIAESLFSKHGLTSTVTQTTTIVPRDSYSQKKEWEVLEALADLEGFVCYVDKDKNGYFGPRDLSDDTIEMNLYYRQGMKSNARIKITDSALDCYNQVTVRHYVGGQLIEATAKKQWLIDQMGLKERVITSSKAITQAVAQQLADSYLETFSRFVVTANATKIIGNPNIVCEKKIAIHGCGRYDNTYYVEKVDHTLNDSSGYLMDISLTSQRPDEAAQYRQDLYNPNKAILGSATMLGKATI